LNTRRLAATHVLCELTRRIRAKAQTRRDSNARLQTRMLEIPPTGQVRSARTPCPSQRIEARPNRKEQTCFSARGVLAGTARALHILAAISVHLSKSMGQGSQPHHPAEPRAKQTPSRRAPHVSTASSPVKGKSFPI